MNVIRNKSVLIKTKDDIINVIGMDERANDFGNYDSLITSSILNKKYTVLLTHYPENFANYYNSYNVDLVLSGHAHGGQFIIPFIGGIYAPGQGFFPKYYTGLYKGNNSSMIVNRGLGNSCISQRLFNKPEIISITIKNPTLSTPLN